MDEVHIVFNNNCDFAPKAAERLRRRIGQAALRTPIRKQGELLRWFRSETFASQATFDLDVQLIVPEALRFDFFAVAGAAETSSGSPNTFGQNNYTPPKSRRWQLCLLQMKGSPRL